MAQRSKSPFDNFTESEDIIDEDLYLSDFCGEEGESANLSRTQKKYQNSKLSKIPEKNQNENEKNMESNFEESEEYEHKQIPKAREEKEKPENIPDKKRTSTQNSPLRKNSENETSRQTPIQKTFSSKEQRKISSLCARAGGIAQRTSSTTTTTATTTATNPRTTTTTTTTINRTTTNPSNSKTNTPNPPTNTPNLNSTLTSGGGTMTLSPTRRKKLRICINISSTKYDVIKDVSRKEFKYRITRDDDADWDVCWIDCANTSDRLAKMHLYQKINHFPGTYDSLSKKNNLARNLIRMRKLFPKYYSFFPSTWVLPTEWGEFKNQFNKKKLKTFILKPEAASQGFGIFLTRSYEDIPVGEHFVAQRYLHKPYLIEGLKFDLRIYVLLYGTNPLRIFMYKEGLARFATEPYVPPMQGNLSNLYMHLTNYAINKNSDNFIFNEDAENADYGHKRSLECIWEEIDENGGDSEKIIKKIKKIIIKTLVTAQPTLSHLYTSAQPNDHDDNCCFEILGFDIILDSKLRPWLLEINHSPSFATETPFDEKVKYALIKDTFTLLNLDPFKKWKFKNKKRMEMQQRVYTGKLQKLTKEEKLKYKEKRALKRHKYEMENLGDYELIYPDEKAKDYDKFFAAAKDFFEEFTGAKRAVKKYEKPSTDKLTPWNFGGSHQQIRSPSNGIMSQTTKNFKVSDLKYNLPPSPKDTNSSEETNSNHPLNCVNGVRGMISNPSINGISIPNRSISPSSCTAPKISTQKYAFSIDAPNLNQFNSESIELKNSHCISPFQTLPLNPTQKDSELMERNQRENRTKDEGEVWGGEDKAIHSPLVYLNNQRQQKIKELQELQNNAKDCDMNFLTGVQYPSTITPPLQQTLTPQKTNLKTDVDSFRNCKSSRGHLINPGVHSENEINRKKPIQLTNLKDAQTNMHYQRCFKNLSPVCEKKNLSLPVGSSSLHKKLKASSYVTADSILKGGRSCSISSTPSTEAAQNSEILIEEYSGQSGIPTVSTIGGGEPSTKSVELSRISEDIGEHNTEQPSPTASSQNSKYTHKFSFSKLPNLTSLTNLTSNLTNPSTIPDLELICNEMNSSPTAISHALSLSGSQTRIRKPQLNNSIPNPSQLKLMQNAQSNANSNSNALVNPGSATSLTSSASAAVPSKTKSAGATSNHFHYNQIQITPNINYTLPSSNANSVNVNTAAHIAANVANIATNSQQYPYGSAIVNGGVCGRRNGKRTGAPGLHAQLMQNHYLQKIDGKHFSNYARELNDKEKERVRSMKTPPKRIFPPYQSLYNHSFNQNYYKDINFMNYSTQKTQNEKEDMNVQQSILKRRAMDAAKLIPAQTALGKYIRPKVLEFCPKIGLAGSRKNDKAFKKPHMQTILHKNYY